MQSLSLESCRQSKRFVHIVFSENQLWRHGGTLNPFYAHGDALRIQCCGRLRKIQYMGVRYTVPHIMQSLSRESCRQSKRFVHPVFSENQHWRHGGTLNPFYVHGDALQIQCCGRSRNIQYMGVRYTVPHIIQLLSRGPSRQSERFVHPVFSENQHWGHGGTVNPFYVHGNALRMQCYDRLRNIQCMGVLSSAL